MNAGGAALLAVASDPIRHRILTVLAREQQCVCELQDLVPVPMNLLSYHLRELREAGLVECTKRGRRRDYRLAPEALGRLRAALPGAGGAGGTAAAGRSPSGHGTAAAVRQGSVI